MLRFNMSKSSSFYFVLSVNRPISSFKFSLPLKKIGILHVLGSVLSAYYLLNGHKQSRGGLSFTFMLQVGNLQDEVQQKDEKI